MDLAKFASDLDEAEKTTMAEGGFDTAEFMKFMQQPSANMDDSGYFSVQVHNHGFSTNDPLPNHIYSLLSVMIMVYGY